MAGRSRYYEFNELVVDRRQQSQRLALYGGGGGRDSARSLAAGDICRQRPLIDSGCNRYCDRRRALIAAS